MRRLILLALVVGLAVVTLDAQRRVRVVAPVAVEAEGHPAIGLTAAELESTYQVRWATAAYDTVMETWLADLDSGVNNTCAAAFNCTGLKGPRAMDFALLTLMTPEWIPSSVAKPAGWADFDTTTEAKNLAISYLHTSMSGDCTGASGTAWEAFTGVGNETQAKSASDCGHWPTASAPAIWHVAVPLVYDWAYNAMTSGERSTFETALINYATNALQGLPAWPSTAQLVESGGNEQSLDHSRITDIGRTLTVLAMYTIVGQGVTNSTVEGYVTTAIQRMYIDQTFNELTDIQLRHNSEYGPDEGGPTGYSSETLTCLMIAALLGRTNPDFLAASTSLQTAINSIPEYLIRPAFPESFSSTAMWQDSFGLVNDTFGQAEQHSWQIGVFTGVARAYGLNTTASHLRWLKDELWGSGGTDDFPQPSGLKVFSQLLGGWYGVTATSPLPFSSALGGGGAVRWSDPATAGSSYVSLSGREFSYQGHNDPMISTALLLHLRKYGALILARGAGGKGSYGDSPNNPSVNRSRMVIYATPSGTEFPESKREGRHSYGLWGTYHPTWTGSPRFSDFQQTSKMYAVRADSSTYGYVAVDDTDTYPSFVTGDSGPVKQKMQAEAVNFSMAGKDFMVLFYRTDVDSASTNLPVLTYAVPSKPTCVGGEVANPAYGFWECDTDGPLRVDTDSTVWTGNNNAFTSADGDGNTSGPWPNMHGRLFVIPVSLPSGTEWTIRGYDPAFDSANHNVFDQAAAGGHTSDSNFEFQCYGKTNYLCNTVAFHYGFAGAHNNNGADGCVYTLTDSPTIWDETAYFGIAGASGFYNRTVTARNNTTKTVTVSSTGGAGTSGCPNVASGSKRNYVLQHNLWGSSTAYVYTADDWVHNSWGRIEFEGPGSPQRRDFLIAMHWGDLDVMGTSDYTACTEINDADQLGTQCHGNGIEHVVMFSDAFPDPWSSVPTDNPATASWPLGSGSVTYDFTCYTDTAIRHVVANFRPDSDSAVSVSNLGGTSCRVTIANSGGAVSIGTHGSFTFVTTNTTVSGLELTPVAPNPWLYLAFYLTVTALIAWALRVRWQREERGRVVQWRPAEVR